MSSPVIDEDICAAFILRSGGALGLKYLPDIGLPIRRQRTVVAVAVLLDGAVDGFGKHGAASLHGQNQMLP
jgi:hypothetical protein